jgi:hypothetical protein
MMTAAIAISLKFLFGFAASIEGAAVPTVLFSNT